MRICFRVIIPVIFLQVSFSFSQRPSAADHGRLNGGLSITDGAFHFQHIGEQDGLYQKRIISIIQDRRGFLWLGTDDGLVRYDGNHFRTFTHILNDSTSLSDNQINCLFEDSRGRLWIGTKDGLNYFNPFTESFIRIRTLPQSYDQTNPNIIYSIREDSSGAIWTANSFGISRIQIPSGGMDVANDHPDTSRISITHLTPTPDDPEANQNIIFSLLIDRKGNFWVGSNDGLMRLVPLSSDGKNRKNENDTAYKFEHFYGAHGDNTPLLKTPVLSMLEDHNGTVWIKTSNGLVRLEPPVGPVTERLHYKSYVYDTYQYQIGALSEVPGEQGDQLWMNMNDEGFTIFDPKKETFLKTRSREDGKTDISIPFFINSIYRDRNGIIWIGTETGGLFKYDAYFSRFSKYNPKLNSIAYDELIDMRFVFEDSRGDLWIANKGVYRCNRLTGKVLSSYWTDGSTPFWTFKNKILEDGRGYVWIASEFGGLYRYDPYKEEMTPMLRFGMEAEDSLKNVKEGAIRAIFPGQIERLKNMPDTKLFISEDVTALARDRHGTIWTGASVTLYSDSSNGNYKKMFLVVSEIDIFAKKIRRYRLNDFLGNRLPTIQRYIYSIYVAPSGIVWMGTGFGLLRFKPQSGAIKIYQAGSGQPNSLSVNRVHAVKADRRHPQRYLWVGTEAAGCTDLINRAKPFCATANMTAWRAIPLHPS